MDFPPADQKMPLLFVIFCDCVFNNKLGPFPRRVTALTSRSGGRLLPFSSVCSASASVAGNSGVRRQDGVTEGSSKHQEDGQWIPITTVTAGVSVDLRQKPTVVLVGGRSWLSHAPLTRQPEQLLL